MLFCPVYFYKLTEEEETFRVIAVATAPTISTYMWVERSFPEPRRVYECYEAPRSLPHDPSRGPEEEGCAPVSSYHTVSGTRSCPSLVQSVQVTKCLARCSAGTSYCPLHLAGGNSEAPEDENEFPKPREWESVVKQK